MNKRALIYIAGHHGMVGSAIHRKLTSDGFMNIIVRSSTELDLRNQRAVRNFFDEHIPDYVFLAAAKVGGIVANSRYPADFIYDNLMIQSNVIHESFRTGVKKLLFLGSSCIYPKFAKQPIQENELLTGMLEPTNEPYAIAKIAGIKMCQSYRRQYGCNFINVMPTNLYGPNDNYDLETSHVLPALVRKICEAHLQQVDTVEVWGSGKARREFLHVDDLAEACVHLMQTHSDGEIINIGTGDDVSIRELAELISETVGYRGQLIFNTSKPDGTPRKQLDVSKMKSLGWQSTISLHAGVREICKDYFERIKSQVHA